MWDYILKVTIIPPVDKQTYQGYSPITLGMKITEDMARILQATPVGSVDLAVERGGGMVLDRLKEPVIFDPRGNVAKS
jgi:spore cortex formation protein SpoVR/YcgB (stage V sporulation)